MCDMRAVPVKPWEASDLDSTQAASTVGPGTLRERFWGTCSHIFIKQNVPTGLTVFWYIPWKDWPSLILFLLHWACLRPGRKSQPVQCGSGLWYEMGLICVGLLRIRVRERVWSEPTVCLSPETDNGHGLSIGKGQGRRKVTTWDIYDGKVATQWVVEYFNQSVDELRNCSYRSTGVACCRPKNFA